MNEQERAVVGRTMGPAQRLIHEFADTPIAQRDLESKLFSLLFNDKKFFLIHESGLITDAEFVDAVAANLVTFALEFRAAPPPSNQLGSASTMSQLRTALLSDG